MEEKFPWIPFYMELAKALLSYKNDRKPLVDLNESWGRFY